MVTTLGCTFNFLNNSAHAYLVKNKITNNTCAIITEVVQGEGGIYPANKEFLEGLRAICDEKDILLIFDEIQCGMGRCGAMYAHQLYGVKPDIMTLAKALGCGIPVGAFVASKKCSTTLVPGDHGTTYGGNPNRKNKSEICGIIHRESTPACIFCSPQMPLPEFRSQVLLPTS